MKFSPSLHKLSNGITVILDPMDIETISMKIGFNVGARNEEQKLYGISHFLEHILCAGTNTKGRESFTNLRNYLRDNGGGGLNAGTGNDGTRYYGKILSEKFDILIDLLADQMFNSKISEKDIEREREVISQEYKRAKDDSNRQWNRVKMENLFRDTVLSRETLGNLDTIKTISKKDLIDYKDKFYNANNSFIVISGSFGKSKIVLDKLEKFFGKMPRKDIPSFEPPVITPCVYHEIKDDKKQVKVCIGFNDKYPINKEFLYQSMAVGVFRMALGSRLFDIVREKNGLVYGIFMGRIGDEFVGLNTIQTELSSEKLSTAISLIAQTCKEIMTIKPVTDEELNRWKITSKFSRAEFMDDSDARSSRLMGHYKWFGELYDVDEYETIIDKMTLEDVNQFTKTFFDGPLSIVSMGVKIDIDMKQVWDNNLN